MFERLNQLKSKTETLPSMSLVIKNSTQSVVKVYFFPRYDVVCKFTLKYINIKAGETRFIKYLCPKSKYQVYQNGVVLTTVNTVEENYGIFNISKPNLENKPLNEGLGETSYEQGKEELRMRITHKGGKRMLASSVVIFVWLFFVFYYFILVTKRKCHCFV